MVAAIVAAVVVLPLLHDDPYVVPDRPGPPLVREPEPARAAEALDRLVRAVDDRDPGAAAALAPASDDTASRLLAAVTANAKALHVVDLSAQYVDEVGPVGADGTWTAAVELGWRFAGFDTTPASEEVQVGFTLDGDSSGDGVGIGGFGGGGADVLGAGLDRTPLWLTGPLQVRRTDTTLVLAETPQLADQYARFAATAVPTVHRVLPRWRARLVIEVPASEDQLDEVLGAAPGTYDNIAAVTATVDGSTTRGTPIHVFVNPAVMAGLAPEGIQVVISHESTHVATSAPLSSMPLWLLEGFADYVALRDVHLPVTTTAGQVLAEVRKDGPPQGLPTKADFRNTTDALGAVYEGAWLACRVVADRAGQAALVDLYDRTDGGQALGPALRQVLGLDVAEFTQLWRLRLIDLSHRAPA